MYKPEVASRIINACATLHNLRLTYNVAGDLDDYALQNHAVRDALPVPAEPLNPVERLAEARRVREQIIRDHFTR